MQALNAFANKVDDQFRGIKKDIHVIKQDIHVIKKDIVDLKASHDNLLNTIDTFIARINHYETEQAARDSQFEKLLVWARKVSEKTGIPLENL